MVYTDRIHLIADSLEELHFFAESIGLNRMWFQNHPRHPHYDVWGYSLRKALKKGVQIVTSKEIVSIIKKNNENRLENNR